MQWCALVVDEQGVPLGGALGPADRDTVEAYVRRYTNAMSQAPSGAAILRAIALELRPIDTSSEWWQRYGS